MAAHHQKCRAYFESSMQYGGGQYIATGRGFATRTSSFVKLYANYGRTHIIPGLELLSMLVVLYILDDCFACNLALMTWGIWLVAFSLILSPFWFNPNAFELSKVAVDFKALGEWLAGEVSPVTGSSWHTWNRKQLEKVRAGTPSSVIPALVFQATPPLLLAFAAFLRVDLHTDLELPEGMGPEGLNWWLQSRWVIAGLSAIIVWSCLWLSARMLASLKSGGRQRAWRVHVARMCIVAAAVLILYFVVFSQMLGHLVLGTVGVMSLIGIIAWAQHRLLFNIGFAQSLQRGRLLQTLRWRRGPNAARGRGGGGIGSGGTAALRPVVVAVPLPAQQPSQGSSGGGGGAAASSSHVRNSQVQHVRISQQHGRRSPRWQVSPLEHVELPMPPIWLAANLGRTQQ
ncbi:hypothetical protein FOA52_010850 [Chlamydomonas sp. UWO 241]|nr:hypothetical protein FOA52_010850 [Chlamydomonas sp. UWO 241]